MTTPSPSAFTYRGIRADGVWTRFIEQGPADAPTVVLVHDGSHGTTADLCWGPTITELSLDHRVIAPELIGFGGTDKIAYFDRSPYVARIAHLSAFCRTLGITSAPFLGVSFGGSLLLRALAQSPGVLPISKALSLAGPGGPYRRLEAFARLGAFVPTLEETRAIMELMVDDLTGLEEHIESRLQASRVPGHWEVQNSLTLRSPLADTAAPTDSFLDDLASVTVPVTLVEGRHDKLIESGWAEAIGARIPGARVVVGDFSHEPNIDRPELLSPIIRDFLES